MMKDFGTFTIILDDGTVEIYSICTYLPGKVEVEVIIEEEEADCE